VDFSAKFNGLQRRVADAKAAAQAAAAESRDQLKQRIHQAQDDLDVTVEDTEQQAGVAAAEARSKWAQMKADAAARREDIKAKIDKRTRELDAKAATKEADWAETDALAAIDYSAWTVYMARLAVLDAIDARLYADERAKAASS
jgi:hypothetical protein